MALFLLSFFPFDISVGVGAFVIGLGQISCILCFYVWKCFTSLVYHRAFIRPCTWLSYCIWERFNDPLCCTGECNHGVYDDAVLTLTCMKGLLPDSEDTRSYCNGNSLNVLLKYWLQIYHFAWSTYWLFKILLIGWQFLQCFFFLPPNTTMQCFIVPIWLKQYCSSHIH